MLIIEDSRDDSYSEPDNIASSNIIEVVITPLVTPSLEIMAYFAPRGICGGVDYGVVKVKNGGYTPTYRWMKNGVTEDWVGNFPALIYYDYVHGDVFSCEMTSSLQCVTISKVISNSLTVLNSPYPSALISMNTTGSLQEGQSIVLKAMPSEISPYTFTYNWYKNGNEIGDQSETLSTIYKSGDVYTVKMNVSHLHVCAKTYTSFSEPLILSSDFSSSITGPAFVSPNQTNVSFSVPNKIGMQYYWTVPENATIVSGQATNSIVVDFGTSKVAANQNQRIAISSAVTLKQTNANAVSSTISLELSTTTDTKDRKLASTLLIYPVPAEDECYIEFEEQSPMVAHYRLYDSKGILIRTDLFTDKVKIDLHTVPTGMYLLLIEAAGNIVSKKIVRK